MGEQSEAAERALALEASGHVVGERHQLEGGTQHELTGVQDEWLARIHLDQVGQVGLILGRVDERVLVVVEQPEEAIEAHVDAGGLHHLEVEGLESDAARRQF